MARSGDRSTFVLPAKLEPAPVRPDAVVRQRLVDRVSAGVRETALTLLSAPAGSGKTSLVAAWWAEDDVPWPKAWLTVDAGDDRPGVFFSYVVAALARAGVSLPHVSTPATTDSVDAAFLSRLAGDLLDRTKPVVLVLDEVDRLSGLAVARGLDFLLRHASPRFRLVLSSRCDPPLPLPRYRVAGTVTEVRAADLAFRLDEVADLLATAGTQLPADRAEQLTQLTEGWAVGVRLAALALRGGADPDSLAAALTDADGPVAQYLASEVLDAQPEDVRDLLLRTSVVDQVTPALADRLTGRSDSHRLLVQTWRDGCFLDRLGVEPDVVYRQHPLLREVLRAELGYDHAQLLRELHSICARAAADEGRLGEAAEHAVAAGEPVWAADLVVRRLAVGRLLTGRDVRLADAVAGVDAAADAPSATVRAALAVGSGDTESALQHIRVAERLRGSEPGVPLAVSIASVTAVAAAADGLVDQCLAAAADAERHLAGLADDPGGGVHELAASVLAARGRALLAADDDAAARALVAAADAAERAGADVLRLQALGELALLLAMRGELRRAAERAALAWDLAARSGLTSAPAALPAALAQAAVCQERYETVAARRWSARAAALVAPGDAVLTAVATVLRSRALRSRGDVVAAARSLDEAAEHLPECAWVRRLVEGDLAALHLAQGHPERAGESLRPASLTAIAESRTASVAARVSAAVALAQLYIARHDGSRARGALGQALLLAEPEQLRRPLVESGPGPHQLLRLDADLARRAAWLDPAHRVATPVQRREPVVVEPLSVREREVLGHLAELMTTEEIAAAMFVSVNTVRTHVRNVLRKLGVSRRNEAVRRARDLSLI